jgi:hypothetical protein
METDEIPLTDGSRRVYQPSTSFALGIGAIFPAALIFVGVFFWRQYGISVSDGEIVLPVLLLFIVYRCIMISIGYRVTLRPEMVEITTLLGSEKMLKDEIEFYEYQGGKTQQIILHSKIANKTKVKIWLSFERDKEFADWFKPILGRPALPEIEAAKPKTIWTKDR